MECPKCYFNNPEEMQFCGKCGAKLEMIDKQCLVHGRDSGKKRAEGFLYLPIFGFTDNGPPLGG